MADTDEKIQALANTNALRLSEMHREHVDACDKLYHSLDETKKEVVGTRLEVSTLNGKINLLDLKMNGLVSTEDLSQKIECVKEFSRQELSTHVKHKHGGNGNNIGNVIKITMPLKIGAAFGVGSVIYILIRSLLGLE
jgi:SMC interacting uncharacterized protein involved in chromosome segregation